MGQCEPAWGLLYINAACRAEFEIRQRCRQRFQEGYAACRLSRKKFQAMEAFLGQIHGFAGGRASGQNRNVEGFETCDQEGGRAGADQETSARLPRLLGLRGGTDGSRADDGIGHGGGDGGKGFQRCLRAQGHFEHRQATGHKSLGQGDGILDLVDG